MKSTSPHLVAREHSIQGAQPFDVELGLLAEAVLVSFLLCKVTLPPPPHTVLFGRKSLSPTHTEGVDSGALPPGGQRAEITFCTGHMSLLPCYLFIQSLTYISIDSCTFMFTFTLVRIRFYFIYFVTQMTPILACRSSFSWLLCLCHPPTIAFCFVGFVCWFVCQHFLTLRHFQIIRLIQCFLPHFSMSPGSFTGRCYQKPRSGCRSCLEQGIDLGVCTNLYRFPCL